MPELAAHLERVANDLEKQLDAIVAEHFAHWVDTDEDDDDAPMYLQCACGKRFGGDGQYTKHANEARRIVLTAALAACAREASEKLNPYCRHLNSCAAFPARSEQQIERDCDCGLIKTLRALERAVGEKGKA